MLLLVTIVFAHFLNVHAGLETCDNGTNFTSNAASCENAKGDTFCGAVFAFTDPTKPVENYGPIAGRHPSCLLKTNSLSSKCAKQCGLCCTLPDYNCENPKVSNIDCSTVQQRDCDNVNFRSYFAQYCPNVCGFCKANGCIDLAPHCDTQAPKICFDVEMRQWAEQYCRKSCNRCDPTPPVFLG